MNKSARLDKLAEFERLALAARRVGGGILADAPPRLPVGGTELSGYRDYTPGDDYRHVDWNVCARHDELRVRQFSGRRDCHVRLLLDCSASMKLGTKVPRFDTARHIAGAVGYVALDRQSRLSVVAFSDRLEHRIGPLRGKGRVGRLLQELDAVQAGAGSTDFHRAAESLVRMDQTAGPVVVVSDLCQVRAFQSGLDLLRLAGFSPRVIHVIDPEESDDVTPGDIELVDAESGRTWQVTLTASQLRHFRKLAAEDRERPRRYCEKFRVPYARVDATTPDQCELQDIVMRPPLP